MSSYYDSVILADSPVAFWPMDEPSGTTMNDVSGNGHTGAYTGSGVTLGATGIGDGETAASYNGASGAASAAIDLSSLAVVSLEFWFDSPAAWGGAGIVAEYTPNYNTGNGFLLDDGLSLSGDWSQSTGVPYNLSAFPQPSAAAWHSYMIVFDRTVTGPFKACVDGVPVTATTQAGLSGPSSGNYQNSSLYLMARDLSSFFTAGTLAKVALYSGDASSLAAAHYAARTPPPPLTPRPTNWSAVRRSMYRMSAREQSDPRKPWRPRLWTPAPIGG